MTPSRYPGSREHTDDGVGVPRRVKVLGIAVAVVVLLVIAVMFMGGGGHAPMRHGGAGGDAPPSLSPKLWYGMPAYSKDGKVVCFFQSAQKFKSRYATFGFNDTADLDEGAMWPTAFAPTKLTAAEEKGSARSSSKR